MLIEFDWLSQEGIQNIIDMVYRLMDIIRIVVPIGLIIMTSLDISKKVINPEDKDGQKKIMIRAIAALIVFLLPTIVDLFKGVANIDDSNLDISQSGSTTPTVSPTPTNTYDPNEHLENILLTGCPSESLKYRKNELISLSTNIPNSYTGNIKWSVVGDGKNMVSLRETYGGRDAQISILDAKYTQTSVKVVVEADGYSNVCNITLQEDRLEKLNIINCPPWTKEYYIGDKITLNTDIPSDYNGAVKWKVSEPTVGKVVGSSNQKSATIEFLTEPVGAAAFIIVNAGGVTQSCYIRISAMKSLNIINCPASTNIYHVGDKIVLKTDVPDTYMKEPAWGDLNNNVRITTSNNGREALVEIISIPDIKYIPVVVATHFGQYTATCGLNVE